MDPETDFRNLVRGKVKDECEKIIGHNPSTQAKAKWKFENSADWHYGHFVGVMEAIAMNDHIRIFKTQPSQETMKDIEEIIEEESKELREYFKNAFKD